MKITLLKGKKSFLFEFNGIEQEVPFSEVTESHSWKANKMISIVHSAIDEYGNRSITTLNRNVFLETMKEGDEEYHRARGAWELNTTIHKLYAILDGSTEEGADQEIKNLSKQRDLVDQEKREWNNNMVVRFAEAEKAGDTKAMAAIKAEKCPVVSSLEMKKMLFAARDTSKPAITFSNVNLDVVDKAYGKQLQIT